jgi:BCD family chlorophyll transporter-like MFS transporter
MQSIMLQYVPFADAASPELPLGRMFRLALFQLSIGITMALLVGTLNRVMIVELDIPAAWVAIAVALPLVFAPLRALIGYRSDTHPSALGLRRIPYMWMGSLLMFGGLAIMPFALMNLSEPREGYVLVGRLGAILAFLVVGAGIQITQTAGLALATDVCPNDKRPRVVALLYAMLLVGLIAGSTLLSLFTGPLDSSGARLRGVGDFHQPYFTVETRSAGCQAWRSPAQWFFPQLESFYCRAAYEAFFVDGGFGLGCIQHARHRP